MNAMSTTIVVVATAASGDASQAQIAAQGCLEHVSNASRWAFFQFIHIHNIDQRFKQIRSAHSSSKITALQSTSLVLAQVDASSKRELHTANSKDGTGRKDKCSAK